jgi:3-hydroxymyristoyl/3-hydroxydecanoyl-(acyl carrier protein) dehydratase
VSASAAEALPHRFPFRLVERVEALGGGRVGIVLSTGNGALTSTHPWPVTLVVEALAQAILVVVQPARLETLRLVALDAVTLHRPLAAGDRLEVEVRELGAFGGLRRFVCRGSRGGALVAEAEVTVSGS